MKITSNADGLVLSRLDLFIMELLRQVPVSAEPGESAAARARLFSKPSQDAEANREWETYVHPELAQLFESANDTVRQDLGHAEEQKTHEAREYRLAIPAKHFERWLSSLNQARLALAARNEFTDREMEQDSLTTLSSVRDLTLFQIHFYGFLQECILREMT